MHITKNQDVKLYQILSSGWNDFTSRLLNQMYSIYYTYEDRRGSAKIDRILAKDESTKMADAITSNALTYRHYRYVK